MYSSRSHWSIAVLFLAAVSMSSPAQTRTTKTNKTARPAATEPLPATAETKSAVWESWDTLKPENEDFSVLMPKGSATEITKLDYHKLELNVRLYLSASTTAPVVGVASMSGIKSNPAAYSDFERFNSYADAFKTFFPAKVRKDAVAKMILTGTKPFHGYTGRVYKLTVGDLSGTVNAYVTRKRFYAIAILNTRKDDPLEEKFLSSFVIPDKPAEQTIAASETAVDPNGAPQSENATQRPPREAVRKPRMETDGSINVGGTAGAGVSVNNQEDNTEFGTGTVQPGAPTNQAQPAKRAPISGGVLNNKAIYLPLPEMPPGERAGVVMVQILVDEQGSVIEARAISGPPTLQAAAINAARLARFLPTLLSGEPVKVSGTLAYNFAISN